jgi:hypothetical protein
VLMGGADGLVRRCRGHAAGRRPRRAGPSG